MAQLTSLLGQVETSAAALRQTATLLDEQVYSLRRIIRANAPLARKLADKMEELHQSAVPAPKRAKSSRKTKAASGKRQQTRKPKG